LELFRDVMVASTSVPVALAPVYIEVEADGRIYDEMHVDGGVSVEVFFYGAVFDIQAGLESLGIEDSERLRVRLFIIRNSLIEPKYDPVDPRIPDIASSSISTLIKNQGIGDLYRIYTIAQRDGFEFNLSSVPPEYNYEAKSEFDPVEMNMLYEMGYQAAKNGYPWKKYPPYYINSE